jgi:quercetin dioxygenase-like cupin family protein
MPIIENADVQQFRVPGLAHQTLAGHEHGLKALEVWIQTIAPGSATPVHRHTCEEIVIVLRGSGRVTIEGEETNFGANTTIVVPPQTVHQIMNTADEEMFIIAAFSETPARVYTPDNELMPLPWQSS